MDDKSTPDASDADAGGKSTAVDDHSQDNPNVPADDKQPQGDAGQPDKSNDKPAEGDAAGGEGKADDKTPAKFDDDLDEWSEKRGYGKPETDRERKLAQDIRNNQRDFHKTSEGKKTALEISKTIGDLDPAKTAVKGDGGEGDDGDPVEKDVAAIKQELRDTKASQMRSEYFIQNEVTPEEQVTMSEILKERVDRAKTPEGKLRAFEYLTDPENTADWHALAKSRLATTTSPGEIEDKARADERERLAKITASDGPDKNASTTSTKEDNSRHSQLMDRWKKS